MIIPAPSHKIKNVEVLFWDIVIWVISGFRTVLRNKNIAQYLHSAWFENLVLFTIWVTIGFSFGFILGLSSQ